MQEHAGKLSEKGEEIASRKRFEPTSGVFWRRKSERSVHSGKKHSNFSTVVHFSVKKE